MVQEMSFSVKNIKRTFVCVLEILHYIEGFKFRDENTPVLCN